MSDLISRQAAIDALERSKDKTAKGDIGGFYNTIIQNDIDKIKRLPSAQPEPQWIPISEREPESGNYLTAFRDKETGKVSVAIDLYWSGGWDDDGDRFETIAWCKLPEPYKGDE